MSRALRFSLALVIGLGAAPLLPAAPVGKEGSPPSSDRLHQLQKERVKALEEQLQGQFERVKIGKDPLIQYLEVVRELCEAELELAENKDARIRAVERMLKELQFCEEQVLQLQQAGLNTKQGVAQAKAARLKAEIHLEKLKLAR